MSERNVPEVRFREFRDEWDNNTLGELTDVYDGTHQTPKYTESGIMFLSVENIKTLQSEKYISEDDFINDFKIFPQKNDILMTRIGDIGTANVVDYDTKIAYYVSLALLKYIKLNPYFLRESIHSQTVKREIWHRTLHIAFPKKINKNEIEKINILFPNIIDEQTKIGEFFKSLDNLIAQNQKKYDKLVNMKKACLDKMFPKDGADTPEVRFKGFGEKWELCKIKDICSISTGKSNTQDRIENGKYPFYVRSSIIEQSNRYLFDEEAVLTVGDGVGTGKVFHYVNSKYDLHQRVYRMFDFNEGITAKYFYYYFSLFFYMRAMSMTAKTSVDSVRLEMISEMNFIYPSKNEQQKLIDYLDNLDTLITLRKTELEKLKNIKKACLNKMFI